ncbi:predicted protein [Clavispora lusitaniae ATCC 42720]|uniref:Uncharacterized protein n=1 Tax=Clavispora lusitaniae (strain ATCC 42720) TaxID=306902 RepID=C4Y1U0_CLAL4|nr:uncharacterized protein CLUG_02172 [Clavispora lusitaniae ATCC 42720]EEQ38047.1 predicted protein [Clavispora lusitaniae ATCC 42720]
MPRDGHCRYADLAHGHSAPHLHRRQRHPYAADPRSRPHCSLHEPSGAVRMRGPRGCHCSLHAVCELGVGHHVKRPVRAGKVHVHRGPHHQHHVCAVEFRAGHHHRAGSARLDCAVAGERAELAEKPKGKRQAARDAHLARHAHAHAAVRHAHEGGVVYARLECRRSREHCAHHEQCRHKHGYGCKKKERACGVAALVPRARCMGRRWP